MQVHCTVMLMLTWYLLAERVGLPKITKEPIYGEKLSILPEVARLLDLLERV